jgi:hypothetical protein
MFNFHESDNTYNANAFQTLSTSLLVLVMAILLKYIRF